MTILFFYLIYNFLFVILVIYMQMIRNNFVLFLLFFLYYNCTSYLSYD